MSLKSTYVRGARAARSGLDTLGLLPEIDRGSERSRLAAWSRSLLSIYDVSELAALDVPWWTFDSSDLVDAFLGGRRNARVFEWGSGGSTIWLSRRAESVVAIEHDPGWAASVQELLPADARVEVRTVPAQPARGLPDEIRSAKPGHEGLDFSDYVAAIDVDDARYDVIVVDGRAREACLARSVEHLAPAGLVVLDNVERRRYREAIAAVGSGFRVTWTRGLTPGLPYPTRTALLWRAPIG